jgi:hypothetical protein
MNVDDFIEKIKKLNNGPWTDEMRKKWKDFDIEEQWKIVREIEKWQNSFQSCGS